MISALLTAVLSASPHVVYCYVQDGCPPCRQVERTAGYGDAEVLVLYQRGPLPSGATGYPAFYDPTSRKVSTGYMDLPTIKRWVANRPAAQAVTAVKGGRWEWQYTHTDRRGTKWYRQVWTTD